MTMRIDAWLRATMLCVAMLFAGSALAADVLVMKNGDRITGKVTKIWDGTVHIVPPYAGEIKVDLDKVKTIDARRDFRFELWSGEKFTGQFGVDAQGKQVLVRDARETPLDLAKVEALAEPKKSFDWSAHADVNADSSSGNTDATNVLAQGYGMVRFGDHRHEGRFAVDYQKKDGTEVKNQFDLGYDYNRLFDERWFFTASAAYERDPIADLKQRVALGAGLGYQFYDDSYRFFKIAAGPAYVHEEQGNITTDTGAAQWRLDFRHKFYRRKFEFFHREDFLFYLGGTKNQVFNTSTGLRMDIVDGLYTNLQFDYDYESKPAAGKKHYDSQFLLGVGLKFN